MHIIKQSSKMKRYTQLIVVSGIASTLGGFVHAHEAHNQMLQMNQASQQQMVVMETSKADHQKHEQSKLAYSSDVQDAEHSHHNEHGGQIYQSTSLENAWAVDEDGNSSVSTELKTWVGTDENKIFIKAHVEKVESEKAETEAMTLYSRNIADFWDIQAGVRYQYQPEHQLDKDQWSAVFGLHGLAPYFFETEAYVFAGQDQRWQLSLETSRDLLFTQKLIAQPYLNADVVLSDESKYAKKSGLSKLQTGVQVRYEINKKLMPFVDVAYAYHKGAEQTPWQSASESEKGWLYATGLTLKF